MDNKLHKIDRKKKMEWTYGTLSLGEGVKKLAWELGTVGSKNKEVWIVTSSSEFEVILQRMKTQFVKGFVPGVIEGTMLHRWGAFTKINSMGDFCRDPQWWMDWLDQHMWMIVDPNLRKEHGDGGIPGGQRMLVTIKWENHIVDELKEWTKTLKADIKKQCEEARKEAKADLAKQNAKGGKSK